MALGPSRVAQRGVCTGETLKPSPMRSREFGEKEDQAREPKAALKAQTLK